MNAACPRAFEVEALRDGRLEGMERARFEQHLRTCPACGAEARALDALGAALRDGPEVDELHLRRERTRLLAAFDRSLVEQEGAGTRQPWGLVSALSAVALLAVLAWWVWPHAQPEPASSRAVVHASEAASWSRATAGPRELLELNGGELWIHVAPGPDKRPLLVKLPDGELEDVGTTFSVRVENRRTMEVKVEEGRVLLRLAGQAPLLLDAGERWSAPPIPPDAAVPPAATEPTGLPEPARRLAPAARRSPNPSAPPFSAVQPAPATSASAASPPDEASLAFKRAVATLNAGESTRAAAELRDFMRAHPADPRAEDAAYLRVIALQRAGATDAMRAAAREYLRRHPRGFRRAEVERLAE